MLPPTLSPPDDPADNVTSPPELFDEEPADKLTDPAVPLTVSPVSTATDPDEPDASPV